MLTSASAKVRLPQIFGNDMMLQQNANANIWGWADKGAKVTITTSWDKKQKVVVTADSKSGRWKAQIATPQGSYEPQQITISDGQPVTLGNVLIGEVWFGSGQSNMEMPLKRASGHRGWRVEGVRPFQRSVVQRNRIFLHTQSARGAKRACWIDKLQLGRLEGRGLDSEAYP